MSAPPPFQLEDETDADFFDKLNEDNFDGVTDSISVEPDDIQAFANLSVNDDADVDQEDDEFVTKEEDHHVVAPAKDILVSEESVSLVSLKSLPVDNAVESDDSNNNAELESKTSGGDESKIVGGVKEVQWAMFNADTDRDDDIFASLGAEADPFANIGGGEKGGFVSTTSGVTENVAVASDVPVYENGQVYAALPEQATSGQEVHDGQYWESQFIGWRQDAKTGEWIQDNQYPEWRQNLNTGEWIQVESYATTTNTQDTSAFGQTSEISYLNQTPQSVAGTVAQGYTTGTVSTWTQPQQGTVQYPANMLFDPQYPDHYYDTITRMWYPLESYHQANQPASTAYVEHIQTSKNTNGGFPAQEQNPYDDGQVGDYRFQNPSDPNHGGNQLASAGNHGPNNRNMWQPETVASREPVSALTTDEQTYQHPDYNSTGNTFMPVQRYTNPVTNNAVNGFKGFVPSKNNSRDFNQPMLEQNQQKVPSYDPYGAPSSGFYTPQQLQSGTQSLYNTNEQRSSAGRPPHALVTFGFGGKLIVMKDCSSYASNSAYGNQESKGGSISMLNIMDVIDDQNDTAQIGHGGKDYFRTLCQQSFPGPLVGGSVGTKELNKWIDERITKCESPDMDYRKGELLKLLLSLLKIGYQYYGRLRSPDSSMKGNDRPEVAVGELLKNSRIHDARFGGYRPTPPCLQNLPPEAHLAATAAEVQNLLLSGRKVEALQCAQEGQLWDFAIQLASDLGEQFYVDTAKQMAHKKLVAGSPLKTLSLLMAGQHAEVFSVDSGNYSGFNVSQHHAQTAPTGMLDDWEKNLAIITANRTKGDELVVLNLGDCLWKERGENIAAHMCYLVAEANFDSFSDSARLCLIGADHWKYPRTYASPDAIQRTEFYEYSLVLGNSQSVLLRFQPYKLIYAHMLAEVGKLSDSLKYCQATLKSLKTNRAPEVDAWKQMLTSLEERIRAHQQSGFGTNLATRKLIDKVLPFIDGTIHRMIGPTPSAPSGNVGEYEHPVGQRVATSQSTMAMQSLVDSTSMEPRNTWANGGNRIMHNRSVSEPDFGRTPRQVDSSREASPSNSHGKGSDSGGPSRFGRIGSTFFGWVSRSRADRQAKLGQQNKFHYDEKLKRWVEEGVEPPAEELAPPPPPTSATFHNRTPEYNVKDAFKNESPPSNGGAEMRSPPSSERSSGIPPIPPSSNQFSARGRMGVRSRYVDTFNKGMSAQTSFSSPSVQVAKPGGGANAKFFIPTPTSSSENIVDSTSEHMQENTAPKQDPPTFTGSDMFSSPPPASSSTSIQRYPSMNNITPRRNTGMGIQDNGNGPLSSHSRRTASWSGGFNGPYNPASVNEIKPLGEALGMSPLSYTSSHNGGSFGDELHEVEL